MIKHFTLLFCLLFLWSFSSVSACANDVPQRIVSLGPINTENIFLLGADARLVADTSYCVRPEAAKYKEKIGSVMQVSIEKIIGLHPDLVLATGLSQELQLRQLRAAGIRVVQFGQPVSFDDICNQFMKLGSLLGLERRAREIIAEARRTVNTLKQMVAQLPPQRVFLQIGAEPLFAAIPGSFTNDFITLAGGINIASDQKKGITNYEKVIAADPQLIVIAMMGSESGVAFREKEKWLKIPVISAVRNLRVHLISPDIICSPSPLTFAQTLKSMAHLIHPKFQENEGL
jgi:iron complex transport system substrate-binding protein